VPPAPAPAPRRCPERIRRVGLLLIAGCAHHVVADKTKGLADIEAGRGEMLQQRRRKRTVLAVAIGRRRAFLGGKGDERVGLVRLDADQTASQRSRRNGPLHFFRKRVVAAGIKDNEAQLGCRLRRQQDPVQRDSLVIGVGIAFERRIDRDGVVDAVDLEPVAGEIDHGDVGAAGLVGEIAQRTTHLHIFQVEPRNDLVERGLPEHLGDGGCVVDGIGQRRDILVAGIADDERDALAGRRGLTGTAKCQGDDDEGG
jgi:hypothetical protein